MTFQLPDLPFASDALEPRMSRRTVELHHDTLHRDYIDRLNAATAGSEWQERELREIVIETYGSKEHAKLFYNAAQAWNHAFFWHSLSPEGGRPEGDLAHRLERDFGGVDDFLRAFRDAANRHVGSGWTWLYVDGGRLEVTSTPNADTPVAHGMQPLLGLDLWEHAYYLDHGADRDAYVDVFLGHLANWQFAARNLEDAAVVHWKEDRYREIQDAFAASGLGTAN